MRLQSRGTLNSHNHSVRMARRACWADNGGVDRVRLGVVIVAIVPESFLSAWLQHRARRIRTRLGGFVEVDTAPLSFDYTNASALPASCLGRARPTLHQSPSASVSRREGSSSAAFLFGNIVGKFYAHSY